MDLIVEGFGDVDYRVFLGGGGLFLGMLLFCVGGGGGLGVWGFGEGWVLMGRGEGEGLNSFFYFFIFLCSLPPGYSTWIWGLGWLR